MTYQSIIICTGVNNDFTFPEIENLSNFKGHIIHSSEFKKITETVEKYERILVVGGASSSINIIEHLNIAKKKNNLKNKLTLCLRNLPYFHLSDYFDEETGLYSTIDTRFFIRNSIDTSKVDHHYMDQAQVNSKASSIVEANQHHAEKFYKDLIPLFKKLGLNYGRVIRASAYKELLEYLRNGEIDLKPSIKKVLHSNDNSKEIEFINSEKSEYDLIIFGTGYRNNLNFLDEEILKDLEYSINNYFYPVTLYKGILHKKYQGLFFIGTFCRQYITGAELQAEYIASILSKDRDYPSDSDFEAIIKKEKLLKMANNRLDVPWLHISYWDSLAQDMGCFPDLKLIKEKDKDLYDALLRLPVYGFQYKLFKYGKTIEGEEYEILREYIMKIKDYFG